MISEKRTLMDYNKSVFASVVVFLDKGIILGASDEPDTVKQSDSIPHTKDRLSLLLLLCSRRLILVLAPWAQTALCNLQDWLLSGDWGCS